MTLPAKTTERIEALAADPARHTIARIRELLAAEGLKASRGSVHAVVRRVREDDPSPEPAAADVVLPTDLARRALELARLRRTPKAELVGTLEDLVAALDHTDSDPLAQALATLQRAARTAEQGGDLQRVVAASKAVAQVAGLQSRLERDEPDDDDDDPDMLALGEEAWGRFERMVDDALEEGLANG